MQWRLVSLKNNAVGAGWNPEILAEQQIALLSFCGIKTWVAVFDVYCAGMMQGEIVTGMKYHSSRLIADFVSVSFKSLRTYPVILKKAFRSSMLTNGFIPVSSVRLFSRFAPLSSNPFRSI